MLAQPRPGRPSLGSSTGLERRLVVLCLAHAGGSAQHFIKWGENLPAGAVAVPVELPGHGLRFREPVLDDWPALVAEVTRAVPEPATGDYALVGHSFGALLAFEAAAALERAGRPPALLVVAARNGPTAGLSHRPIHALPDEQLLAAVARLGGTPGEVLDEPELLRMWLPALRTDLRLAETYARPPASALTAPIAAFVGRHDRMADPPGAFAWHRETTGRFDLTVLDAGHFLLDHPDLVGAVAARLEAVASGFAAPVTPG